MPIYQSASPSNTRRSRSSEAISLAMASRWQDAADLNRSIITEFPTDLEASNRLGKALMELGEYAEARAAFERSLAISPRNNIAKKNLMRLSTIEESGHENNKESRLTSQVFVGDGSKTSVVPLEHIASRDHLAKVAPGDSVGLVINGNSLVVTGALSQYLGVVNLRVAARLVRLMERGNQYVAAVARVDEANLTVVISETYQSSEASGVPSFLVPRSKAFRANVDGRLTEYEPVGGEYVEIGESGRSGWSEDGEEPDLPVGEWVGSRAGEPERDPEDED